MQLYLEALGCASGVLSGPGEKPGVSDCSY